MRRWAATLIAVGLAAASALASAQSGSAAASPAQRCLTRGGAQPGTPEFPPQAYQIRARGRVKVELAFDRPDAPPRVLKLQASSNESERYTDLFEQAVQAFVQGLRVPCLGAGETSQLHQEYEFVPYDQRGVTAVVSYSPDERRAEGLRDCVKHLTPDRLPEYPTTDNRVERQGTAVIRTVFKDADTPPEISVLDDGGSRWFGEGSAKHAAGFRMPCHDKAGPVDFVFHYIFRIEGGARTTLKDAALMDWLRYFKGIQDANVYFDFNTMGCPFKVSFKLMQPYSLNKVGDIGAPNPERRFFLDWLTRQQFNFPPAALNRLLGQRADLTVPCTVLSLGTSSGGGASK